MSSERLGANNERASWRVVGGRASGRRAEQLAVGGRVGECHVELGSVGSSRCIRLSYERSERGEEDSVPAVLDGHGNP